MSKSYLLVEVDTEFIPELRNCLHDLYWTNEIPGAREVVYTEGRRVAWLSESRSEADLALLKNIIDFNLQQARSYRLEH
jgi:hypothetical protein